MFSTTSPLCFCLSFIDVNCASGFITLESLEMNSRLITIVGTVSYCINRFYKAINFNCTGVITHVIAGAKWNNSEEANNSPEVRLWRSSNGSTYTQSGPKIKLDYTTSFQDSSVKYLRWYNLSKPVSVQQGDVVGIYQPPADAESILYYQGYSGPLQYCENETDQHSVLEYNVYPLLSVIFSKFYFHNKLCETEQLFTQHQLCVQVLRCCRLNKN